MDRLAALVAAAWGQVARGAGRTTVRAPADIGAYALAGADTPADVRLLARALATRGFARTDLLRNDAFAVLRTGTDRGWGVAVICGAGVGAAGIAPDGRTARLHALGEVSGDWGGGASIGWAGLAAAVRSRDGRGPATELARLVPEHFHRRSPAAVTAALYGQRIPKDRVRELSPVVFAAAAGGDLVARGIVDRMADEVVAMAGAMLGRLGLRRLDPEVVLGGGVFRTDDAPFYDRIVDGLLSVAPAARPVRLPVPPVAGAALIGLDAMGIEAGTADVQSLFIEWDRATG